MQKDNVVLLLSQFAPENLDGEVLEYKETKGKESIKNMTKAQVEFIQADSSDMLEFEKEIAYFYGAKTPNVIEEHYFMAIVELERRGSEA